MSSDQESSDRDKIADNWSCPLPLRGYPNIVLGHGGGGKLSSELIEHIFLPAFSNETLATLADAAVIDIAGTKLAFSTDAFVVRPLFFPGGCIGDLAVHGTLNDLAMVGASPIALSASFILEEGLPIHTLQCIVQEMAKAANRAQVAIVTGDTKVVERGHGDGCYITTSGVGIVPKQSNLSPTNAKSDDVVLISGTIGDHGMAIMSVREGLEFEAPISSDTAALYPLVAEMLAVEPRIRVLRDPTRGGLAASLNEIAKASRIGIVLNEQAIPVAPAVRAACELLGLDPLLVANEGKLVAIVPPESADAILQVMRRNELGKHAARIGTVVSDHPGIVASTTPLGTKRIVTIPVGEQLPRIC